MQRDVILEQFFTCLISGNRHEARGIVDEVAQELGHSQSHQIIDRLFWPTLVQLQKLHRADQLTELAHHYATRLMRSLVDQLQLRLKQSKPRGKTVMLVSGPEESEELGSQMVCDLLEADGYEVYFCGGGVPNDEIVNQIGQMNTDILVVWGAMPSTVPFTRQLIDHLHAIGVCPRLQIVVGGGVFNRADGLAEEIGSDLWAKDPLELIEVMGHQPKRRMSPGQRTVGRKRRVKRDAA